MARGNRMIEAATKLAGAFAAHASIVVSYTQLPEQVTIEDIVATPGRTPFLVVEGDSQVSAESRDYIVAAADLVLNGAAQLPKAGDRITEADGTIYEVAAPSPNEVYERVGANRAMLRIHTKGPFSA